MRRRHLRKKAHENQDAVSEPPSRAPINTGVLSFDIDEAPVVGGFRKRSEKRRGVAERQFGESEVTAQPPPQLTSVGAYTEEKLAALKAATVGVRTKKVLEEPLLKVTGSFKPASTSQPPPEAFIRVNPDPQPQHSQPQVEPEIEDDHFMPPNSQTIQMAKAKRERLRQAQLAPDYLPLGGASSLLRQDVEQSEHRASSESDAEEDHMRLQFISKRSNTAKVVDEEMDLDLMEDEDAVDSFVDAQIKKGITALGLTQPHKPPSKSKAVTQVDDEICVLPEVTRRSLAAEAQSTWNALMEGTAQLQQHHSQSLENEKQAQDRLQEALKGIELNKTETAAAERQYTEVQEMRAYIADLCDCLKEKLPYIEAMEDHVQELFDGSADQIEQDSLMEKESLELAEIASNAVLETIAAEETLEQATQLAGTTVQELQATFETSDDPALHQRAVQRGVKRKRQWEAALRHEAIPKDSETPPWQSHIAELMQTSNQVFSDVLPEMSSIPAILARFAAWKEQYPKLYDMAYLPESLSTLLSPFVRCEMVTWSPFYGSELSLDAQSWYRALEQFGDHKEEHLVPEVVKQVVLPSSRHQIQKCWTPFEPQASHTVAEMTRELLVYVPMEDSEMQKLLQMVQEKFREAVSVAGIPPFTRPALMASSAVQSVVEVRFGRALGLTESFGSFSDILPAEVLRNLLMKDLICDELLPYIRTATVQPRDAVLKILELLKRVPQNVLGAPLAALERMQIAELLAVMSRAIEKLKGGSELPDDVLASFVDWLRFFKRDDRAAAIETAFK